MKEFEFINSQLAPVSEYIGDDCAFFDGYAITKDILSAGVHFFSDDEPYNLARKIIRVNLSDLAACGAKPFGILVGAAIEQGYFNEKWLREFTRGIKADMQQFDFALLGGDTVVHKAPSVFSITAIGLTNNPLKRSGAKPGNNIFVSGAIGAGYVGLRTLSGKYILPEPRISLGLALKNIATSCIDISDGLLADLGHICKASNVGAEIFAEKIPLANKEYNLMKQISGGDDYELCFTANENVIPGCYNIGKIVAGEGIILDGKKVEAKGWQHTSS